jgi:hypothetical protein
MGKNNHSESFFSKFSSLDIFTRLFIVTIILFTISTPFIVYNYQLYKVRGESQAQRLKEIAQLQDSQKNMQNAFTGSEYSVTPASPATTTSYPAIIKSVKEFNLADFFRKIFLRIAEIF